VGDVQQIVDKILYQYQLFKHSRFLAQIISGDLPHEKILHSIELLGREVKPAVEAKLGIS
jgi:hypothetical protein